MRSNKYSRAIQATRIEVSSIPVKGWLMQVTATSRSAVA